MKNISKAVLILALVLCLGVSVVACDNDEFPKKDTSTDTAGDTSGNTSGNTSGGSTDDKGGVQGGGANTDDGWGALIPLN